MPSSRFFAAFMRRTASIALSTLIAACSGHADGSGNSLIGKWNLAGDPPNSSFQATWLAMTFKSDGTIALHYKPALPLYGGGMNSNSLEIAIKPRDTTVPYEDLGGGKLRITSGAQADTYTYELKGDKLYLTPPASPLGTGPATVYNRQGA